MNMTMKRSIGFLVAAVMMTTVASSAFASPARADDTPPAATTTQPHDQKSDLQQLRHLLEALRDENKQEHALRAQLHKDMKEIARLVRLSRSAQQTDDLKQALAEVQRLHEDLKVIHETRQQWKVELAALKDYRQHKQLDKAIAQVTKLKGILDLQIDQLQAANAKAEKLIGDLKRDLTAVGVDPGQV